MKTKTFLSNAFGFLMLAGAAQAGPASDLAEAHIDNIAKGDVAAINAVYGEDATLFWVGGPLDGDYDGDDIKPVWEKFTKAQGTLEAEVANLVENGNPKGSTVSADVFFKGEKTIPVRYVMTFRGDKLVSEVWQIAPNLKTKESY